MRFRGVFCLAAVLVCAGAVPASADELTRLFQQIIDDPGNAQLNRRYAAEAEARGELRKALSAYERILDNNPDDSAAKAELNRIRLILEPPKTVFHVEVGGAYETNAPLRDNSFLGFDDTSLSTTLSVRDQRTLGDLRWETNGVLGGRFYNRWEEGDTQFLAADTGPILPAGEIGSFRVAAGAGTARLSDHKLYNVLYGVVTHLPAEASAYLRTSLRVGREDYGSVYPGRDGAFVDLSQGWAWEKPAGIDGVLVAVPRYHYQGSDMQQNRYHQIGVYAGHQVPLTDTFAAGPELTVNTRVFDGAELGTDADRRDYLVSPGVRGIISDVLPNQGDIQVFYTFERNFSNDYDKSYSNHAFGGSVSWDF